MILTSEILKIKDIEPIIYNTPQSDLMYDVYLVVKAAYNLTSNLEGILSGEVDVEEVALNYEISDMYSPEEPSKEQEMFPRRDSFGSLTWNGSPAELAFLMGTLHEKGYIDVPMRNQFDRNNEKFHKIICSLFTLADGAPRSVLNALKDNTISPNNTFKIALEKLPRKA